MMNTLKLRFLRMLVAAVGALVLVAPAFAMDFVSIRGPSVSPRTADVTVRSRAVTPARLSGKKLPRGAIPLKGQELFELYVGKTWRWGEGGGYFGSNGVFRARTHGDNGTTEAGGTWAVNDKGRMCFRAVWTDVSGSSKANTCFDHVQLGGDLYQRRIPNGDWYIFRHAVPTERDEYNKLVGENLLTTRPAP